MCQHSRTGSWVWFSHTVSLISRTDQSFDHFYPKALCLPETDRKHLLLLLVEAERTKRFLRNLESCRGEVLRKAENKGSEGITLESDSSPAYLCSWSLSCPGLIPLSSVQYCTCTEQENCKICHILQSSCIWNIFHSYYFLWGLLRLSAKLENIPHSKAQMSKCKIGHIKS